MDRCLACLGARAAAALSEGDMGEKMFTDHCSKKCSDPEFVL
jgi:hypothetical protein